MLVLVSFPQLAAAQGFTSATVLEWSEANQDAMFQTSVTMIGVVAAQMNAHKDIARCIDGWYLKEGAVDPERNEEIRETLSRFPEIHPQAVILAVVEKACGKFRRD